MALYHEKRQWLGLEDIDNPSVSRAAPPAPDRSLRLGAYEVHTAPEGFSSIRHHASGEIMHSHTPPMEEARALYVEQSLLAERLADVSAGPLVIWDVGLGAAANAMAAIECYETLASAGPARPLHMISFENDLDSLRLALRHKSKFPSLRHGAPEALLARGMWTSRRFPGLSWQLLEGDFQKTLTSAPALPDLIFYDMFSSRTHGDEWTVAAFRALFSVCGGHPAELFTYSTSTAVRTAFLAAGFHVAKGRSTGVKLETTIALTPARAASTRHSLLGGEWLAKWQRSHAQYPDGLTPEERPAFARLILGHPQFLANGL